MVAKVTCHNWQQRQQGYVTFGGTSRGRRGEIFGVEPTQRSQLPQNREEECGGVMKMDEREGAVVRAEGKRVRERRLRRRKKGAVREGEH